MINQSLVDRLPQDIVSRFDVLSAFARVSYVPASPSILRHAHLKLAITSFSTYNYFKANWSAILRTIGQSLRPGHDFDSFFLMIADRRPRSHRVGLSSVPLIASENVGYLAIGKRRPRDHNLFMSKNVTDVVKKLFPDTESK